MEKLRTYLSMGLLYALTAHVVPMAPETTANYGRGVIGVLGFMTVEGVDHVRELMKRREHASDEYARSAPDRVYHALQILSGSALFGMLFGTSEGSRVIGRARS
ncbi:hypothetical protein E4T43_08428 [Aureobasidium subglaciale]|nr:hypothetical protein E4T43_08428 [Aureobasidium subglaciale]